MPPGWKAERITLVATMGVPHCGHIRLSPAEPRCPRLALAVLLIFCAIPNTSVMNDSPFGLYKKTVPEPDRARRKKQIILKLNLKSRE
jgi:hypothetical protein